MTNLLRTPVTFVWLLLVAATVTSLWASVDHGIDEVALMTVAVITIAVAKAYLVGAYFMELRHAPRILHGVFVAWCAACGGAVLGVYFFG